MKEPAPVVAVETSSSRDRRRRMRTMMTSTESVCLTTVEKASQEEDRIGEDLLGNS